MLCIASNHPIGVGRPSLYFGGGDDGGAGGGGGAPAGLAAAWGARKSFASVILML